MEKHIDINDINTKIDQLAKKWNVSNSLAIIKSNQIITKNYYGYQNRLNAIPTTNNSTYLFSLLNDQFVNIATLKLIDSKKLSMEDYLDKYIPEYIYSNKIQIKHLMYNNSGIPDYFAKLVKELTDNEEYKSLSFEKQYKNEKEIKARGISFSNLLKILNSTELDFVPGTKEEEWSETNALILAEVITRVSKTSYSEYIKNNIFDYLGMNVVKEKVNTTTYGCYECDKTIQLSNDNVNDCVVMHFDDIIKFAQGLFNKKLLSKNAWRLALKTKSNNSLIYYMGSGWCWFYQEPFLGYTINIQINYKRDIMIVKAMNEMEKEELIDGKWYGFSSEVLDLINETITYPLQPKVVPFSSKYLRATMNLSIFDFQKDFVCDAKTALCYAYSERKTANTFIIEDCGIVIGILVLEVNKKENDYGVEVVLIDKKYQRRGYGRIMVGYGVEWLKKKGARELFIGVNRHNIAAQALYKSLGYKEDKVWTEGILMKIKL